MRLKQVAQLFQPSSYVSDRYCFRCRAHTIMRLDSEHPGITQQICPDCGFQTSWFLPPTHRPAPRPERRPATMEEAWRNFRARQQAHNKSQS